MKKISTYNSYTIFGYFIMGAGVFILIILLAGFFKYPEDIIGILIGILLIIYIIYLGYQWTLGKRTIIIDKENGKIYNDIRLKEKGRKIEYNLREIKDYGVIHLMKGKEVMEGDPTFVVPYSVKNKVLTYIGYIEFEGGRYLGLYSGTKRKVKKKMEELQLYIEGDS